MDFAENANELITTILENSFDEIFIVDATGKIIYTRDSNEKLFGIPYENIIHQNVFQLEKEGVFSPSVIVNVLKDQKEATLIQVTKTNRKLIVSGHPIFDDEGQLIGVVSFSRDITEVEFLKKENEEVANAIQKYREEIENLKRQASHPYYVKNNQMGKVLDIVSKVAGLDLIILLEGESGVGKNHLAYTIHQMSQRRDQPFIEVNCGAISESLIEAELFGYEDGAFTGAKKGGKKGYFESAGAGTLFLDEIGELPLNLQVKFLSVLQNQSFMRVGGSQKIVKKCRIICATNQNLEELIRVKRFREDLYYRINVVKLKIPPLRERKSEIIPLIYEITEEINVKYGMNKYFSPEMVAWLSQQEWPGNIRELYHFIEKAIVIAEDEEIDLEMAEMKTNGEESRTVQNMTLTEYLDHMEREFIIRMYKNYPNSIQLAKALGISQSTASRKIRKHIGTV